MIWLIRKILDNFESKEKGTGMPLGNYTSQFFANVYLNELDYFIKHRLKAKHYIRYVDDFIILHRNKKRLEYFKKEISNYLKEIKLEIHPQKSKILPLRNGVEFLGYRVFYHHKLLRKRNIRTFMRKFEAKLKSYEEGLLSKEDFISALQGWFGYSKWANTHKMRSELLERIEKIKPKTNPQSKLDKYFVCLIFYLFFI